MDFDLSPEEEAFRAEVRQFIAENLPPVAERSPSFIIDWWKAVREKRWVGFSWPREVGGGGASGGGGCSAAVTDGRTCASFSGRIRREASRHGSRHQGIKGE